MLPNGSMAPESQGHVYGNGVNPFADGHDLNGPPPSTLAAQLVENISTTAQSARTDETAELKRLSVIIERVKDQPELLRTIEDRIEHNNMLIYVYTRVVLEGFKWGEASLNPAHVRAEALKALEFLKVTIKEAPGVLVYRTDGSALLFRGSEPLWAWLLPKILKLLVHEECASITAELKSFCRYVLEISLCDSGLRELSQFLLSYCHANIKGEFRWALLHPLLSLKLL
jgi:serine/threonine-protein kinase ATR